VIQYVFFQYCDTVCVSRPAAIQTAQVAKSMELTEAKFFFFHFGGAEYPFCISGRSAA
jgi:hypothetical protein